jgi:hypothetical protein
MTIRAADRQISVRSHPKLSHVARSRGSSFDSAELLGSSDAVSTATESRRPGMHQKTTHRTNLMTIAEVRALQAIALERGIELARTLGVRIV